MKLKHLVFVFALIGLVFSGCSKYQKLLKSQDYEQWYTEAMRYYEKEDYTRAATLLNQLVNIYRGTDKAEEVNYVYANCLYGLNDFMTAGHFYREYVKSFPAGDYAEECQYMSAYCYYMRSPKPRLDQTTTEEAIQEFQLFINMYPNSARVEESTRLMDELRDKLVYKSYLSAKLYYNLGDYLGNNYKSAVIAAQNSLRDFPDTKYREELSFLILESKYIQAVNSVEEKKEERVRDTLDEYYSFVNEFPEGKMRRKAERIFEDSDRMLKEYNKEVAVN
ncbi:outer membrane protein assembly factor BamD [Carboxylicivirga sp. M1479]|uniref:outer membrane protein assembly factor BamD n=1 Tax=Carboxylicivirga sp. M1479 TaxID=2594476 RepID=UPI001177C060|nr:outer membrane protein assembly factor BamD [Carboxylicivirga sp. M1479]TRX71917.1 outer membrane protein assembly factor BamD [Carboxylicivirga sp. M1479]